MCLALIQILVDEMRVSIKSGFYDDSSSVNDEMSASKEIVGGVNS